VRTDPNTCLGYDLQARANGYNPSQIKPGSAADRRVIADLGTTLNRWQGRPAGSGKGGIASGVNAFRAEAAQTVAMRKAAVVPTPRDTPVISATGITNTVGKPIEDAGRNILRTNPIVESQWRSTVSPVTRKSGFSEPLQKALNAAKINSQSPIEGRPASGTTSNSGAARNVNGKAAEIAIANELRRDSSFSQVEMRKTLQTKIGPREVDVTAIQKEPNPEYNKRLIIESKLGAASLTKGRSGTISELTRDAALISENRSVRHLGSAVKVTGKIVRPIGIAIDAVQLGQAYRADGNRIGDRTQRAAGAIAGGAAGAWGGAQAGAAIGSMAGPVGTVVGVVVGGIVGGVIGSGVGEKAVGWVKGWF
jgi:trimeric autotransporter adhesin